MRDAYKTQDTKDKEKLNRKIQNIYKTQDTYEEGKQKDARR